MISSKQLLDETGISRATLNNYIKRGLIPRPVIRTGAEATSGSARLGYFDDEVVDAIRNVQDMIKSGMSMDAVCLTLGVDAETVQTESVSKPAAKAETVYSAARPTAILANQSGVNLEDYESPAYMVNNQFELIWWNDAAIEQVIPDCRSLPGELEARAVLKLLLQGPLIGSDEDEIDLILACHLIAANRRLNKEKLFDLALGAPSEYRHRIDNLVGRLNKPSNDPVLCFPLTTERKGGAMGYQQLYASYFREGILFTYGRTDQEEVLANVLTQRPKLISSLLRQRKPHITSMAVIVADLQESVSLCSELPAEEYFELINQIWQLSEPIFRKYQGTYGKHAGDGMLYYFLPQPDSDFRLNAIQCSLELQHMMRDLTAKWQERKGWFNELHLNIGMHEGREWFGAFHAGSHVEFTVLGDTVNQASRISDFARGGSIWATKSMINQIPSEHRSSIHYGVYRQGDRGERRLVAQSYACIRNLTPMDEQTNPKFREIEMLPITEILSYND